MKTETITALLSKLAIGIGTAATLAGGGAIISSASTNAVQDQRITVLEKNSEQMTALSDKLDETNKNVAVLNERLNQETGRVQPTRNR